MKITFPIIHSAQRFNVCWNETYPYITSHTCKRCKAQQAGYLREDHLRPCMPMKCISVIPILTFSKIYFSCHDYFPHLIPNGRAACKHWKNEESRLPPRQWAVIYFWTAPAAWQKVAATWKPAGEKNKYFSSLCILLSQLLKRKMDL